MSSDVKTTGGRGKGFKGGNGGKTTGGTAAQPDVKPSHGSEIPDVDGGPLTEISELYPFVSTKRYTQIVDKTYDIIIQQRPSASRHLSKVEFRHVMRLALLRRIEDVRFAHLGVKPHAGNRSPLPRDTRIPQPIWTMLAAIGYTETPETGYGYLPADPTPRFLDDDELEEGQDAPQGNEGYTLEYVEMIADCVAYDFETCYTEVVEARAQRIQGREAAQHFIRGQETPDPRHPAQRESYQDAEARLQRAREVFNQIRKFGGPRVNRDGSRRTIVDGNLITVRPDPDYDSDKAEGLDTDLHKIEGQWYRRVSTLQENWLAATNTTLEEARQAVFEAKRNMQQHKYEEPAFIKGADPAPRQEREESAYGANLGVTPELIPDYIEWVSATKDMYTYSLSFPNEPVGSAAWILEPRRYPDGSQFVVGPTKTISPADFSLGVVAQLGHWMDRTYPTTWNIKSSLLLNYDAIVVKWVSKALITDAPVGIIGI